MIRSGIRFFSRLSGAVTKAGKGKTVVAKPNKASGAVRKVGPVSTLDMGAFSHLRGVSVAERKTHLNVLDKVTQFSQLRIHPELREAIKHKLLKSPDMPPTPVQKVAIKALRRNAQARDFKSWLIAAETGSGKTLAYLAPLLSNLLESKSTVTDGKPFIRSIVLVPTIELVEQVCSDIKLLAPSLRLAQFAGLEHPTSALARQVKNGVDIAVGTPDKFLKLGQNYKALAERALQECRTVVVDEADSLMNRSFVDSTTSVIDSCAELDDLVFVTATIPRYFDKELRSKYPQTGRLVTPSIHRFPRHIEFRVVEVWRKPYLNKKHLALQQALYSIYHDNSEAGHTKRVVVFVNLKKDVGPLVDMLNEAGYNALRLDGGFAAERQTLLQDFLEPAKPVEENEGAKLKVLVATDLVARGVDFHRVRNIILYDMPFSAADLLHRAGRTGRLGTKGRVLLFVTKSEHKGWVRGLETVVKRGMALA